LPRSEMCGKNGFYRAPVIWVLDRRGHRDKWHAATNGKRRL
jgi:hypothetical protein